MFAIIVKEDRVTKSNIQVLKAYMDTFTCWEYVKNLGMEVFGGGSFPHLFSETQPRWKRISHLLHLTLAFRVLYTYYILYRTHFLSLNEDEKLREIMTYLDEIARTITAESDSE